MTRMGTAAIGAALVLAGCTAVLSTGSGGGSSSAPAQPQTTADRPADKDLFLALDIHDGEFLEIPGLPWEELESLRQAEDYRELARARLEDNGVYLTPGRYETIFPDVHYAARPLTVSRYGAFDILFVRYPGYRGTNNGDLYVFENALYKGRVQAVGDLDFNDCYRVLDEDIWLAVSQHAGGSGLSLTHTVWLHLNDDQFPAALFYTRRYAGGNLGHGRDLDFSVDLVYDAVEEDLYLGEEGLPVLRVAWEKTVSDSGGHVAVTCAGYEEYTVRKRSYREQFDVYEPGESDCIDGLEEQLGTLARDGSRDEKYIASRIVEAFSRDRDIPGR